MSDQDLSLLLQQQVAQAAIDQTPICIRGGDSKAFYGGDCRAVPILDLAAHSGVIAYEPTELVITARAGTSLQSIMDTLATQRQMLAFEPPLFSHQATLGGTMACGFSGPRRPFAGAARDFMLGCKIINGHAEILSFGGQVMKNVAGFDVSRLMVGALGSLGVLLELSVRVLPLPEAELTLTFALTADAAINRMNTLAAQAWPLSAQAYDGECLHIRLSGTEAAIQAAARKIGGDINYSGEDFWLALREQQLGFFHQSGNLWRICVAPASPALPISGDWLLDWNGALRWLKSDESADAIHTAAAYAGGHAVCFRAEQKSDWIKLDPGLLALQQRIRTAFDPLGLFNPGRLHRVTT